MIKHSNTIDHCFPDTRSCICKLSLASLPQSCSRSTMWVRTAIFFNFQSSICQTLPPPLPSPFRTTLTCFWIWRNPPHIQIEVIRSREDVLLRIKIKAVYDTVSPELCYFTIELLPPNQKWEKGSLHHSLHLTDQFTFKWGWSAIKKCCIQKWTKIEKQISYI